MNLTKRALVASSLVLVFGVNLFGDEVYTIQNKTLKEALEIISKKSNLSYIANDEILNQKRINNIENIEGTQKALDKLLEGTGLKAIIKNEAIVIVKNEAKKVEGKGTVLEEISVDGSTQNYSAGYINQFEEETSTGSRLGLTIKETPASVEVVNSKTMEQRGDTTVQDTLDKTIGMTSNKIPASLMYSTRGFIGNSVNMLYDGTKILGGTVMSVRPMDNSNLDKVEIIRGANSVLYGEGSIGASINLITKKPSFTKQDTELGFKVGSYDSYRFNFGTGGVAIDDVLAYRFDYSTSEKGSNIDGEKIKLDSISLGLLGKINDNLFTTLQIDKTEDNTENPYYGTPLIDGKLSKELRKENYNNLEDGINTSENLWIKQGMEWYPTSNIEVKNQFYHYDSFREWKDIEHFTYNSLDHTVRRQYFGHLDHDHKMIGDRIDILHKGNILGLENKFVIGTDISKTDFKGKRNGFPGMDIVDASNPEKKYFSDVTTKYKSKDTDTILKQYAIFIEEQLNLSDNLKFVCGVRYDTLDANWTWHEIKSDSISKKYNAFSYKVGFVYDITDMTTFYTSYNTGTEPGGPTMLLMYPEDTTFDLTKAEQYEIGIKQSFLNYKAEIGASLYQIKKKNIFTPDPKNPNLFINVGRQSSKGLEFNIGLQPTKEFQIDANVGIVDAQYDEYQDGNLSYNGNNPYSIPKYVGNLGVRYMPISELGIGTWIRHVDSVYTDEGNTLKLPAYTTVDLTLDYTYNKNTTFSFMIKNLTDEFYATRMHYNPTGQVMIGNSRNYEFGVNYKF